MKKVVKRPEARALLRSRASGDAGKIVRRAIDPGNLPPLTDKQKADLAALAAMPESEIDYTDVRSLPEAAWDEGVRGRFYRPLKQATTVRLDADVLAWLKSQGKGYQTRINAILREAMLRAHNKS